MIRLATTNDLEFLVRHDRHIPPDLLARKIRDSQVCVSTTEQGEITGWLRYGLFWDLVPFMNMLYVLETHRGRGFGRQLVEGWERDMLRQGVRMVMTSTQSDEEAQHFYRKLGYVDSGVLLLPEEPAELIFRKHIGAE